MKQLRIGLICGLFALWIGCNHETVPSDNSSKTETSQNISDEEDSPNDPKQSSNDTKPINDSYAQTNTPVSHDTEIDFPASSVLDAHFVNSMREWRDSANEFSTQAELLAVAMKTRKVKLLKENGVTITVDYDTLSHHDQNYITEFILAQRAVKQPKLVENFD